MVNYVLYTLQVPLFIDAMMMTSVTVLDLRLVRMVSTNFIFNKKS